MRVTDAQFAVLEALWENEPQTIRQLTAALYPSQSTSDYATVQKLLTQLHEKGCVEKDTSQFAHTYRSTIVRATLIDAQLREVADKLSHGSLTSLMRHLVEGAKLGKRDRDDLRRMLDEKSGKGSKKGKGS